MTRITGARTLDVRARTSKPFHVNILLDTGMEQTVPLVRSNVEILGFRFADTKIVINSHAHFDHVGGDRDLRDATRAQVMVMAEDADEVRHGHPDFALGWKGCPRRG